MKQAIVVRTDLEMGKGKLAAQVAHASLSAAEASQSRRPEWYSSWRQGGQAKIVLKVGSEDQLRDVLKRAKAAGLPAVLIEDRGLTQVEPGSATCVGIGPAPDPEIDAITGNLKLL
jgi:peptidyl-tRNA hydrolase, PTH2 family